VPVDEPFILVIEDDPGIRDTVSECLEFEVYLVAQVSNGAEGLEYLHQAPAPKLIVLDLLMPVMNGSEFIERMRREPALASIPVVLMTAAGPSPAAAMQADDHLYKPFDLSTLLNVVARFCGPPRAAVRVTDEAT
jgi:CheY-like chemotaxis protein